MTTETIQDLTTAERDFCRGKWDSYIRTFDRHREAGNAARAESNRRSIRALMEEAAAGKTYQWPEV